MGQNKYKKLISNSLIFGIGDIGSKGITLLLVPMYTFFLTQSEYGTIDIIQVTINLLVPILSLSIFEAILRYVMDKEDTTSVFTNCFLIAFICSLVTAFIFIVIYIFSHNVIMLYICLIIILQIFHSLFSQFIRGMGKVKIFAINGILVAFITASMNVILIVWLNLGIQGYLLSIIAGFVASIIYININVNSFKYLDISSINGSLSKKLLKYSLPLMPNSIMWWIINASSRYIILIFTGTASNGLFAVSSKIPSVLSIFNSIFFKAWQLSAIEEYDSKSKSSFYSIIFNYYQQFLFIVVGVILLSLKMIFKIAIGSAFYDAWKYTPFLLVAVLFSSFSSFLGTNYIASKETKGVFKSSVIGGIANVVLNFITIPLIGVIGASVSSMISFIIITVIRAYDTRKYIRIKYQYKNIFINLFLIFLIISVMYWKLEMFIEFTLQLFILIMLFVNNKILFKSMYGIISKRFIRKA